MKTIASTFRFHLKGQYVRLQMKKSKATVSIFMKKGLACAEGQCREKISVEECESHVPLDLFLWTVCGFMRIRYKDKSIVIIFMMKGLACL